MNIRPDSQRVIDQFVAALELEGNITSSIASAMKSVYELGYADGEIKQIAKSIETLRGMKIEC